MYSFQLIMSYYLSFLIFIKIMKEKMCSVKSCNFFFLSLQPLSLNYFSEKQYFWFILKFSVVIIYYWMITVTLVCFFFFNCLSLSLQSELFTLTATIGNNSYHTGTEQTIKKKYEHAQTQLCHFFFLQPGLL